MMANTICYIYFSLMHIGRLLDRKNIIGYFLINSAYLNKNNNFPFASSLYVKYIES